jgi:1-acyl-sn-glycerol-3-phosphate acyltransferase
MKNWSLGYQLLRYYVQFALWLSHRRIVVTGRQLIPKGKPIIFAANHQNALMDSLSIVCTNPSQSVWLARADIFKSKFIRPILNFLKMAPVYRIRDGKDSLSNNEQIFALVTQILENKDSVCLFPEAAHSGRRQMLPHKKAIPRIALEAEEKNNFALNLQIVPVGIYYSHYWKFDRNLIVQYGKPIDVDNYREEYARNPQKTMLILRDEIHDRLAPLTIQINSQQYYFDYENIRQIAGKTYSKMHRLNGNSVLQLFLAENQLIKKVETMESTEPEVFDQLISKTRAYFSLLDEKHITDEFIQTAAKAGWPLLFIKVIGSILTLPILLTGFVFNAIPFFIPRNILRKKIKDMAFTSTFFFATGLLIFPIIYLLEALVLFALTKSWIISVSAFVLMPFAGKIAFKLMEFFRQILLEFRYQTEKKSFRNDIHELIKQRTELIELIIK